MVTLNTFQDDLTDTSVDTQSQIALSTYVYSLVAFYFDYTVSYMYRGLTVHCNSSSITHIHHA